MSMRGLTENTPLHVAALRGDRETVRALLEAGADPNVANDSGTTPLHAALQEAHAQVARMLVAAGASLDASDRAGVTPRDLLRSVSLWEGES